MTTRKKAGLLSKVSQGDVVKVCGAIVALTGFHFWGQLNNDTRATETKQAIDTTVKVQYQKRHYADSILEQKRWDSLFHIMNDTQ